MNAYTLALLLGTSSALKVQSKARAQVTQSDIPLTCNLNVERIEKGSVDITALNGTTT